MVFGRTSFTIGMEFLDLNGWPRKLTTAPKLDSDAFPLCTLRREALGVRWPVKEGSIVIYSLHQEKNAIIPVEVARV
jgi:hypothetical protein